MRILLILGGQQTRIKPTLDQPITLVIGFLFVKPDAFRRSSRRCLFDYTATEIRNISYARRTFRELNDSEINRNGSFKNATLINTKA